MEYWIGLIKEFLPYIIIGIIAKILIGKYGKRIFNFMHNIRIELEEDGKVGGHLQVYLLIAAVVLLTAAILVHIIVTILCE